MKAGLNDLKRDVFFRLMEAAGRVFILVRYSEAVRIGRRGFLPEEKEKGITLVFNKQMKFTWDESGIHGTLQFGTPVRCFIPPDDIVAVYSPELGARFIVAPEAGGGKQAGGTPPPEEQGEKVIKVDFKKRR